MSHKNCIVYDITDWEVWQHLQTGGSRKKKIVKNPQDNNLYYYKTSLYKGERYYKYEFWSEILASKLGQYFGFNVLDYNIGISENEVGCISKSMLSGLSNHELIEGRQYLAGTNVVYDPDNKRCYDMYTFQFIEHALHEYKIEYVMDDILRTIVFDCIIGNSDRHQDNWSVMCLKTGLEGYTTQQINLIRKHLNAKVSTLFEKIKLRLRILLTPQLKNFNYKSVIKQIKGRLAPIYDSGCCLAREFENNALQSLDIDKYITKGMSEIRWESANSSHKKVSHFELICKIREYNKKYSMVINREIERVLKIYNKNEVRTIVFNIDKELCSDYNTYSLPDERKNVICDIIDKRINKIEKLMSL